jgi:hypothetical protein
LTHLPNGTYYIEVIANPERVLPETNMANDVSLRKIILGRTPDHRTCGCRRLPPNCEGPSLTIWRQFPLRRNDFWRGRVYWVECAGAAAR